MAGEFSFGGSHKNDRRFNGIKGRRPDNAKFRREEAAGRNAAWANLSTAQQLATLDARLGKDVGAKKQRARLAKLIELKNGK